MNRLLERLAMSWFIIRLVLSQFLFSVKLDEKQTISLKHSRVTQSHKFWNIFNQQIKKKNQHRDYNKLCLKAKHETLKFRAK